MSPASCSLDQNQQISGPSGGGKLWKCTAFTGEQETSVNPIHVYLYVCAYHSDDAGRTRKSFHLPFITSIQSLFIPCPGCSDFFFYQCTICSLQPIHLSSTDVSLQDEKSQTLTSHVWIEMVREAAVLRSGAGCPFDDVPPLFGWCCFFLSLLPPVLDQRVPHVGARAVLRHFHPANPGVVGVDSRHQHQGGVRPTVCASEGGS